MSKVKIYRANYQDLQELIPVIFRDFPFNFKNKKVFLKPNMLSARKPEEGVTTHPELVRVVAEYILEQGGELLVGDNPSLTSEGSQKEAGEKTGLAKASLGHFLDISRHPQKVRVKELGDLAVSSEILNCDILISLPKFKTHPLTLLTGAVKNMYGILVGEEKPRLHYQFPNPTAFSQILTLIYEIRRPDLIILDGIVAMEGFGPSNGDLRSLNRIIVSRDGYACDWVLARMVKRDPARINFLSWAMRRGFFNPKAIEVEGDFTEIEKFRLPLKLGDSLPWRLIVKLIYHPFRYKRVSIIKEKCRLCGACEKICPKAALRIEGRKLKYEKGSCIACFCCLEVCPEGAIKPS
ncbi:MAG: DUF362 domain-containing protein [candidate division WOR-3 bacterium]